MKGFISLSVALAIGLTALGTGLATYFGAPLITDRLNLHPTNSLNSDTEFSIPYPAETKTVGEAIEEVWKERRATTTFYIKPKIANIRACPSTTDFFGDECTKPIDQVEQNTEIELPYSSIQYILTDWVPINWNGRSAYINKSVLSETPIESGLINSPTQQQTQTTIQNDLTPTTKRHTTRSCCVVVQS